jgi:hypothetical protein
MDLKSVVSQVVLFDRSYRVSNDFALANSVGIVPEMLLLFAKLLKQMSGCVPLSAANAQDFELRQFSKLGRNGARNFVVVHISAERVSEHGKRKRRRAHK